MTPNTVETPFIRFQGTSRYSRHGDTVALFVERIDNHSDAGVVSGRLALQLWACRSAYAGGVLKGWKLAESPLGVIPPGQFLGPVESKIMASFPESGDFAMTLVIAEWDGEGFNRIHDFHNYPWRDLFVHPRIEGMVKYRLVDEDRLVVDVERIHNPREPDNLSGTLSLELWALPEPYVAGDISGHWLAGVTLGTLAGSAIWQDCTYDVRIARPPAGTYTLVLMLKEWAGGGYVTRDHRNLSQQATFPVVLPAVQTNRKPPPEEPDRHVAGSQWSARQPARATQTGHIGTPDHQAGFPVQPNIGRTRALQTGESVSLRLPLVHWKQYALRLWDGIRKQLSL